MNKLPGATKMILGGSILFMVVFFLYGPAKNYLAQDNIESQAQSASKPIGDAQDSGEAPAQSASKPIEDASPKPPKREERFSIAFRPISGIDTVGSITLWALGLLAT